MLDEDIYVGDKIRQIRTIRHISQEELGNIVNLNKQAVSRIEKGIRRVSYSELVKIAEFLNEPIETFTEREIKFKLIHQKNSVVAIPKFAIDFLNDYREFIKKEELTPDAVRLIYDEITITMNSIFIKRFPLWKRIIQ